MRDRKADNLVRKQLWLEQCAWANRHVMTPSELRLWSALKARQLGVQFRREVPLAGRSIVDFCAPSYARCDRYQPGESIRLASFNDVVLAVSDFLG
ncbi:MAG TPA: DUF559 domain-containing protein [Polyangiaceae bacterium]|nr:DUF559 domain-containing protein [Polyangiaceae bacterium]